MKINGNDWKKLENMRISEIRFKKIEWNGRDELEWDKRKLDEMG